MNTCSSIFLILSLFSLASALIRLPVTKADHPNGISINEQYSNGPVVSVEFDQSRVRRYQDQSGQVYELTMYTNLIEYYTTIDIGTPYQHLYVMLDTGSATLAVPDTTCGSCAGTQFDPIQSSSYESVMCNDTRCSAQECNTDGDDTCLFRVTYADQSQISGGLGTDIAQFTAGLNVTLEFGLIQSASGTFSNGVGGIMGLAYNNHNLTCVPSCVTPAFDSLVAAHLVDNIFAMQINPTTGGVFDIGGYSTSEYVSIQWTPIIQESFYVVDLQGISVGDNDAELSSIDFGMSVVDSGTTFTLVPSHVYSTVTDMLSDCNPNQYMSQLISDTYGVGTCLRADMVSLDTITDGLPDLVLHFQGASMIWKPKHYITRAKSGSGYDIFCFGMLPITGDITILGDSFMQAYYVVFDRENSKVGFGYTEATTLEAGDCSSSTSHVILIVLVVLGGFLLVSAIAIGVFFMRRRRGQYQHL